MTAVPFLARARRALRPDGEMRLAFLLNAPALIALAVVVGYPIVQTFWFSLNRYTLAPPVFRWVGLQNYVTALTDPPLQNALKFSLLFSVLTVPLIILIGVGGALVLNESFRGRGLVRTFVVIPWAVPAVVNGALWSFIFNSKFGALNGALFSLGIIDDYQAWLLDPATALPALVVAHVWHTVPVAIIVILAALQAIPGEMYEAARVDRAGVWSRFTNVTFPWLQHAILIVLILQTITAMKVYDIIYVLTAGGPGSATTTIAYLAFQTTFRFLDFGLGSTYSFLISIITLLLAVAYFRLLYSRGDFKV